mmetsp:Transcript_128329/g.332745  ORF Transcript_128329/g.332745 Transcript_128329/m.332745 type:complete len:231 (-) Transcript_128329:1631-2323(-)
MDAELACFGLATHADVDWGRILKRGVSEAVAERIGCPEAIAPIAGIHSLRIRDHLLGLNWDGIALGLRKHYGQTSCRHLVAKHNVAPRIAGLLPSQKHDEDTLNGAAPWHQHCAWRLHEYRGARGCLLHRFDQGICIPIEVQVWAVPGLPARGCGNDDGNVRALGCNDSLGHVVARGGDDADPELLSSLLQAPEGCDLAALHVPAAAARVVVAGRPIPVALTLPIRVERR